MSERIETTEIQETTNGHHKNANIGAGRSLETSRGRAQSAIIDLFEGGINPLATRTIVNTYALENFEKEVVKAFEEGGAEAEKQIFDDTVKLAAVKEKVCKEIFNRLAVFNC